ncbi:hypothetical protein ACVXZ4_09785 [Lacisediminihabitans sp. FW035]
MTRPVKYAEIFHLVDAGEGRWVVKHASTNELAGTIMSTSQGIAGYHRWPDYGLLNEQFVDSGLKSGSNFGLRHNVQAIEQKCGGRSVSSGKVG